MSDSYQSLNNIAWEKLFDEYDILEKIEHNGLFQISGKQIKEHREPRLMAKFDHSVNLPKIFSDNDLAILPITRGDYVISHFDAYHRFEDDTSPITRMPLPQYIESIDPNNIPNEAIALNCAMAAGIIADFLGDEELVPTISGRMGSGAFEFDIHNTYNTPCRLKVNNSQIEIDASFEGIRSLAVFEAKRDISDDFLIRQIYYPFRTWKNRIAKPVRTIFLIYSNSIYRLYEYTFEQIDDYNSLVLASHRRYSIDDIDIKIGDIKEVLARVQDVPEPEIPFPQADRFDRVVNLCELLNEQKLSRDKITEEYAFDARQTTYYTDAARYLGLIEKGNSRSNPIYELSPVGKEILRKPYRARQLAFCERILSHQVFKLSLHEYFNTGKMPSIDRIVQIMKRCRLYKIGSESTFGRRASTIRGWINWAVGLANET